MQKMLARILAVFMVVLMVVGMFSSAVFAAPEDDYFVMAADGAEEAGDTEETTPPEPEQTEEPIITPEPVHEHSWSDWSTTKSPTCTEDGLRERSCSGCGEWQSEPISATGHSWNSGETTKQPTVEEEGVITYTCNNCGTTRTEPIEKLAPTPTPEPTPDPLNVEITSVPKYAKEGEAYTIKITITGGKGPYSIEINDQLNKDVDEAGEVSLDVVAEHEGDSAEQTIQVKVIDVFTTTAKSDKKTIKISYGSKETEEDWKNSISSARLTGTWPENLVSVARTQIGYKQSSTNFIIDDNGDKFSYSRYGDKYGDPYGEWGFQFIRFCLDYAEVPDEFFPDATSADSLVNKLEEAELFIHTDESDMMVGDIIFIDKDKDGYIETSGIITERNGNTTKFIKGNENGEVKLISVDSNDASIYGYGGVNKAYKNYLQAQNDKIHTLYMTTDFGGKIWATPVETVETDAENNEAAETPAEDNTIEQDLHFQTEAGVGFNVFMQVEEGVLFQSITIDGAKIDISEINNADSIVVECGEELSYEFTKDENGIVSFIYHVGDAPVVDAEEEPEDIEAVPEDTESTNSEQNQEQEQEYNNLHTLHFGVDDPRVVHVPVTIEWVGTEGTTSYVPESVFAQIFYTKEKDGPRIKTDMVEFTITEKDNWTTTVDIPKTAEDIQLLIDEMPNFSSMYVGTPEDGYTLTCTLITYEVYISNEMKNGKDDAITYIVSFIEPDGHAYTNDVIGDNLTEDGSFGVSVGRNKEVSLGSVPVGCTYTITSKAPKKYQVTVNGEEGRTISGTVDTVIKTQFYSHRSVKGIILGTIIGVLVVGVGGFVCYKTGVFNDIINHIKDKQYQKKRRSR